MHIILERNLADEITIPINIYFLLYAQFKIYGLSNVAQFLIIYTQEIKRMISSSNAGSTQKKRNARTREQTKLINLQLFIARSQSPTQASQHATCPAVT